MPRKFLSTAALGLLSLSPALAEAQTPAADRVKAFFVKADTNHDGALSLEEWKAAGRREEGFRALDANHDGQVTPDEIKAAAAAYRQKH